MEKMLDAQEQLVREKTKTSSFAPVLVLMVLAPTLAEVLLGNVLFNGMFVWQLVIDTVLYGSGAILVREVARRRYLGWLGIVVLALASGALIETMLFGFLLVSRGSLADLMLHLVLCVVLLLGLWWIARRLRATEMSFSQ